MFVLHYQAAYIGTRVRSHESAVPGWLKPNHILVIVLTGERVYRLMSGAPIHRGGWEVTFLSRHVNTTLGRDNTSVYVENMTTMPRTMVFIPGVSFVACAHVFVGDVCARSR